MSFTKSVTCDWVVGTIGDHVRVETGSAATGYRELFNMPVESAEAMVKELLRAVEMLRLVPAVEAKALVRG